MHHTTKLFVLSALFSVALAGCEGHQEKVDALQKEYDQLGAQMQKDCSAEYLKVPPTLSQKCIDENKKVTEAWKRLQAERTKQ
jgi:hypothetical protein